MKFCVSIKLNEFLWLFCFYIILYTMFYFKNNKKFPVLLFFENFLKNNKWKKKENSLIHENISKLFIHYNDDAYA